jgi:hypothetical protein
MSPGLSGLVRMEHDDASLPEQRFQYMQPRHGPSRDPRQKSGGALAEERHSIRGMDSE